MKVGDEVGRSCARQAPAVGLDRERRSTYQGQRYPQVKQQHACGPLWTASSSLLRQNEVDSALERAYVEGEKVFQT